ncbi:MAG TPA: RNA polymerase sigma factor [Desulfobacterales bacterium]
MMRQTAMRQHAAQMEAFLESIQRRAFRMARFAVGGTEDALDVVQDAMTALVRRYAGRSEKEWKVLFYRILRSKIIDWHRRNRLRMRWRAWFSPKLSAVERDGTDPIDAVPDPDRINPAERVLMDDTVAAVDAAVQKLPLRQQQAFLLRAWEEMSVSEAAAAMQCSEGSVKTHYARALKRLRQELGEYRP